MLEQNGRNLLHETVPSTATIVILLELDELELAERLEDILEVLFGDAEVDVADVEAVERNRVGMVPGPLRAAYLTILLRFGELDYDRDT